MMVVLLIGKSLFWSAGCHLVGSWKSMAHSDASSELHGIVAPDLELEDHRGDQFSLFSHRGKWVLLMFGATYSPPAEARAVVGSWFEEREKEG